MIYVTSINRGVLLNLNAFRQDCIVEHRNMNYLSFNNVNKKRKNLLPSENKDAIFIFVATSYLVSNKEIEKTY